jgi:hypothetical protein
MKAIILLAAAVLASAQDSPNTPQFDARLHADVVKLVELSGTRAAMRSGLKQLVSEGKTRMLQACPGCNPAFADEWGKRMLSRINLDDFIDVYVRVYEKHFNDDEVIQLIALQKQIRSSRPQTVSPELKRKLAARMTSIQSEIMGGTTRLGAKLEGDVGAEIEREHPEYLKQTSKVEKP